MTRKNLFITIVLLSVVINSANGQWTFVKKLQFTYSGFPQLTEYCQDILFFNDSTGLCHTRASSGGSLSKSVFEFYRTQDYGVTWASVYSIEEQGLTTDCAGGFQKLNSSAAICQLTTGNSYDISTISSAGGVTPNFCCLSGINNFFYNFNYLSSSYGFYQSGFGTLQKYNSGPAGTVKVFSAPISLIKTISSSNVVVSCNDTVFFSNNAGSIWTTAIAPGFSQNAIDFPSTNIGYITCNGGNILKTNTAGATWTVINTGYGSNLGSVSFKNDSIGFCIAGNVVLKTFDGGQTWSQENVPTVNTLRKVVATQNKAYVVDNSGSLFRRDIDSCSQTLTSTLSVSQSSCCVGSTVALSGSPTGGVFLTQNGPLSGSTYSATSGGTITLGYIYVDSNTGCLSSVATGTINAQFSSVYPGLSASQNTACIASSYGTAITFTPYPQGGVGGTLSGAGVAGYTLFPQSIPGTYTVTYTVTDPNNGCPNTANLYIDIYSCVGIEEFSNAVKAQIYPIPAYEQVTVTLEAPNDEHEMVVYDLQGIAVSKTRVAADETKINLKKLPPGLYILTLKSKREEKLIGKIIHE